jgi:hypothetical protein
VLPRVATVTGLSNLYESAEPAILANAAFAASQKKYLDFDTYSNEDDDDLSIDTPLMTPAKPRPNPVAASESKPGDSLNSLGKHPRQNEGTDDGVEQKRSRIEG